MDFLNVILEYTNLLPSVVKKKNLLIEVSRMEESISKDVVPSISAVEEFLTRDKAELLKNDKDKYKAIVRNTVNIKSIIVEINENLPILKQTIIKYMPDFLAPESISVKYGAILGLVERFESMVVFSLDYLTFLMYNFNDDIYMMKIKDREVRRNIANFNRLALEYKGKIKTQINEIPNLSDAIVNKESETIIKSLSKKKSKFKLPYNGFRGNPFYHIGMWLTDGNVDEYEELKDKRRLIELRIIKLKSDRTGEHNPKLEKQIEYFEEKIKRYEYKMKTIKEDVEE